MSLIVEKFMTFPVEIREGVVLFLFFVLWGLLGRKVLRILSIIPFLIRKAFRYIYLLIEIPVAALHKKIGLGFYHADKFLSDIGEKIDRTMQNWHGCWRASEQIRFVKLMTFYIVAIAFILLMPAERNSNGTLEIGKEKYLCYEEALIRWFEKHGWYSPSSVEQPDLEQNIPAEMENTEEKIALVVFGVNSSLLVRDIPSVKNSVTLERIYNDDTVIWTGQLVFAEVSDGEVEPWVKVVTSNEIEGWSRLYYLKPEKYSDMQFYVTEQSRGIYAK